MAILLAQIKLIRGDYIMKDRYLKVGYIKKMLQTKKALIDLHDKFQKLSGIYDLNRMYKEIHMHGHYSDIKKLAKTLNVELKTIKRKDNDYAYSHESYFYYEGFKFFLIHSNIDNVKYNHDARKYKKELGEILLDVPTKEDAFKVLKENYKGKDCVLKWINSYEELNKYIKRHSSERYNYSRENIESQYLSYKNNFKPLDYDVTWREAERLRPNDDCFYPLSFIKWCKVNL